MRAEVFDIFGSRVDQVAILELFLLRNLELLTKLGSKNFITQGLCLIREL